MLDLLSGFSDGRIDFSLSLVYLHKLRVSFLTDTFHSEVYCVINEPWNILNVLDVNVLAVGKDFVMLLDWHTLLVSCVSVPRTVCEGTSVASADNALSAVLQAVRLKNPLPSCVYFVHEFVT